MIASNWLASSADLLAADEEFGCTTVWIQIFEQTSLLSLIVTDIEGVTGCIHIVVAD